MMSMAMVAFRCTGLYWICGPGTWSSSVGHAYLPGSGGRVVDGPGRAADGADQVDDGVGEDADGVGGLVAGGVQGGGEAGPVGVEAGLTVGGVGLGGAQDLVDDE